MRLLISLPQTTSETLSKQLEEFSVERKGRTQSFGTDGFPRKKSDKQYS